MALNDRQRAFLEAYLIEPNGKKAAIAAGYSPATAESQASRLLRHVEVAAELARGRQTAATNTGVTIERVLAELARIGFADIRKVVGWRSNVTEVGMDPDTDEPQLRSFNEVEFKDSTDIDDATAAAIAEISQGANGTLKVKLHDKRKALVDIGRHLGMFDRIGPAKPAGRGASAASQPAPARPGNEWDRLLN